MYHPQLIRFAAIRKQQNFMIVLVLLLLMAAFWPNRATSQVEVTASAGTPGPTNYNNLGTAFTAINIGTHMGTISIRITANVTETGTAQLNGSGIGAANYTSINIKGSATTPYTITGTVSASLIFLNGASNVTVDGTGAGTSDRNLIITNTANTFPQVFKIGSVNTDPITNVTIKNCVITNGANSSNAIVVAGATTGFGYFNNITIDNNDIRKALTGIYLYSVPTPGTQNITITNNLLNNSGADAIRFQGIFTYNVDGILIAKNQIGNFESATGESDKGISLNESQNATITENTISNLSFSGSAGVLPSGIYINSTTNSYNLKIASNTVRSIVSSGSNPACGIYLFGNVSASTISGNNISNIVNNHTLGYAASGIYIRGSSSSMNMKINNNFIQDILNEPYSGRDPIRNAAGISIVTAGKSYDIDYNTIMLNTMPTKVGSNSSSCIMIDNQYKEQFGINLRNNLLVNLQTTGGGSSGVALLNLSDMPIFFNIDYNDYYSANGNLCSNAGGVATSLNGVKLMLGGNNNSLNVLPNFVSATDLHLTANNPGISNKGTPIAGITTDIDMEIRSTTTPDIGADEFIDCPTINITQQPTETTICENGSGSFSVTATNASSYQWQLNSGSGFSDVTNGSGYSGANTAMLTISTPLLSYSGYLFRCVLGNTAGCDGDTTDEVKLTVGEVKTAVENITICQNQLPYSWNGFTINAGGVGVASFLTKTAHSNIFSTIATASNGCNGIMFDITPKTDFSLYALRNLSSNTQTSKVIIYFREGGYSGYQTNPSAWTVIDTIDITAGVGEMVNLKFTHGIPMKAGIAYGIYISDMATSYGTGSGTYSNDDLVLTTGAGLCGKFSGVNIGRIFTGSVLYNTFDGCDSTTTLNLYVNTGVTINTQPVSPTINAGSDTSITVDAAGTGTITRQWQVDDGNGFTDVANGGIYNGDKLATLTLTGVPFSMNGYKYRCVLSGSCGNDTTDVVTLTVNKLNQTLSFASQTADDTLTVTYGAAIVNGKATATSGLTVNYTSNNTSVAVVDAMGNVTIVNAGIATITASQSGDNFYNSATDIKFIIKVLKKAITITANDNSKTYGDADPALTYTLSAPLVAGDNIGGAIARDPGENAGEYAIKQNTLSLSNNYDLTFVNGKFTVNKKSVTVTADAASKIYGETDPSLTYSISTPLAPGDVFTGSIQRTAGENAGIYAINQNTLSLSSNYTLTYVSANFTINKRDLYVTIDNKERYYGEANPAFTFTFSGFVNGDNNTAITSPSATTTANTTSVPGNYPITWAGGTSVNYNLLISNGTMRIKPVVLNITKQPENQTVCSGKNVSFGTAVTVTPANGLFTYQWQQSSDGMNWQNISGANAANYNSTGQASFYYRCMLASPGVTLYTNIVRLAVNPTPLLTITKSGDISCASPTVQLFAFGADNFEWTPATGLSNSLISNPVATPPATTTYEVTGYSSAGCSSTASITVTVTPTQYLMANAFTPNNDGKNDNFGITHWGPNIKYVDFRIYNRNGEMVFVSRNSSLAWDGRVNGHDQPQGTYVYYVKALTPCGPIQLRGTVTLVR